MDNAAHSSLQEYAYAHTTTDYVTFTEATCSDLLCHTLLYVEEQYSEVPNARMDPVNDLFRVLKLGLLDRDFDLQPQTAIDLPSRSAQLLREFMSPTALHYPVDRANLWMFETEDASSMLMSPPIRPICRSRLETHTGDNLWPRDYSALTQRSMLRASLVSPQDDQPMSSVELDEILDIRFDILPEATGYIQPLLHAMLSRSNFASHLDACLYHPSPPLMPLEATISPPIFPLSRPVNDRRLDTDSAQSRVPESFGDLASSVPLMTVEEPKSDDALDQHLVLVNGWHAFAPQSSPSPFPTPSLDSGTSDLDELPIRSPSPISAPPDSEAKIESVLIPRSHRLDGGLLRHMNVSCSSTRSLRGLLAMATGRMEGSETAAAPPITSPACRRIDPTIEVDSSSLVVQLSENMSLSQTAPMFMDFKDIQDALPPVGDDPAKIVMDEKLEKDHERFTVPLLPSPSEMQPRKPMLQRMLHLIKPSSQSPLGNPAVFPLLKKLNITKLLNKELSWMPFSATDVAPTYDQLLGVDVDIKRTLGHTCFVQSDHHEYRAVIEQSLDRAFNSVQDSGVNPDPSRHFVDFHGDPQDQTMCNDDIHIEKVARILNRSDRRRLQGLPFVKWPDSEPCSQEGEPRKRLRLGSCTEHSSTSPFKQPPSSEYSTLVPAELPLLDPIRSSLLSTSLPSMRHHHSSISQARALHPTSSPSSYSNEMAFFEDSCAFPTQPSDHPHPSSNAKPLRDLQEKANHLAAPHYLPVPRTATASVDNFLQLRPELTHLIQQNTLTSSYSKDSDQDFTESSSVVQVPDGLIDGCTITLPRMRNAPLTSHCYLASNDLVQKSALVSVLGSVDISVILMERQELTGSDIFVDPHAAICVVPLLALPVTSSSLLDRITRLSTRCDHVLILFEGYLPSHSTHLKARRLTSFDPFSAPVTKAIQSLRRGVVIAQAHDPSTFTASIQYAFATSVAQTAAFIRAFGDAAERRDLTGGALWVDRHRWLTDQESQEEYDLAYADGMNAFAAAVVLAQTSFGNFLKMSPEARYAEFAPFIGGPRVEKLNTTLAQRMESLRAVLPLSPVSATGDLGTSPPSLQAPTL